MNQGIPTPNDKDLTAVRNVLIGRLCEAAKQLDRINTDILLSLLEGFGKKSGFDTKAALDRSVEYNGSSHELLGFYAVFGVVPYVLEVTA